MIIDVRTAIFLVGWARDPRVWKMEKQGEHEHSLVAFTS